METKDVKLKDLRSTLLEKVKEKQKMINFLREHEDCPACEQHIDGEFKNQMIMVKTSEVQVLDAGSADTMRGTLKELEAIAAAVVGGCLLTGGYGSAIGAAFGAIIFGTVSMGIFYTDVDTDWFKVFLGAMMLIAVIFNNYIRRKVTESK